MDKIEKTLLEKLIAFAMMCNDYHDGCLGTTDKELKAILGNDYREQYKYLYEIYKYIWTGE
ncbi:unnamed protein product [marine sediment metagenome]|uniref:Uncharacterized protein n=1 Tax=marine sediment metagenome TaxID=412755 RepID=X0UQ01_9ZZZZ